MKFKAISLLFVSDAGVHMCVHFNQFRFYCAFNRVGLKPGFSRKKAFKALLRFLTGFTKKYWKVHNIEMSFAKEGKAG
jgi:hypothetical protein